MKPSKRNSSGSAWSSLPTERIHPRARHLDRLSGGALLRLMAQEDRRVVSAVLEESRRVERAASWMAETLRRGGRVFFLGAGTSGRLGVLEAAECPPTFGTDPGQIEAIVAGGRGAVFRAREGAEDREQEARAALRQKKLGPRDMIIGISASSVTPFVRAGLEVGRRRRARTVAVTCGPRRRGLADLVIAPRVGPEILAGSTRLKCGTATKMILNALTLLAMKELGKIYGPFMVDLKPRSAKLRDRARRIVAATLGTTAARAGRLVAAGQGNLKAAIVMGRTGVSLSEAKGLLAQVEGDLRRIR